MRTHLASLALALTWAIAPIASAQPPAPLPVPLAADVIAANRILVNLGVIDVRGHVSVRDPVNPNVFWITKDVAPGNAVVADLQAFDFDGKQVGGAQGVSYTERFIHARIYKARPDIKSVVHAHTKSVIVFSQSDIPLRPVSTSDTFIGNNGVPIHSNGSAGEGIHDIPVGDELAKLLGQGAAVMMRGHGMVVVGDSIQSSVGRAVGLDVGAQEQIDLLSMGGKVTYLTAPADAAKNFGNYAREWSWWTQQIQAR